MFSALASSASESRTGGVVLSSVLLAVPALLVAHAGAGAILLVASLVLGTALLEGRTRAAPGLREVTRLAPVGARVRVTSAHVRARWEVVERDGRRSLSMRWS